MQQSIDILIGQMNKLKKKIIIVSLILTFIITGYYFESSKNNSLLKHAKTTTAKVEFFGSGIRNSTLTVRYNFHIGAVKVLGQVGYAKYILNKNCLPGKIFHVVYDSTNPSNSQILITREDYYRFNIPQPDSFPCVYKFR